MRYDASPGSAIDMLGEEASEVIKEVFKANRFGLDTRYTAKKVVRTDAHYVTTTPRERLRQEIGDLLVTIRICIDKGYFTREELDEASERKNARLIDLFGRDYLTKIPEAPKI